MSRLSQNQHTYIHTESDFKPCLENGSMSRLYQKFAMQENLGASFSPRLYPGASVLTIKRKHFDCRRKEED